MNPYISDLDFDIARERHKDRLREAQHSSLVRQVQAAKKPIARPFIDDAPPTAVDLVHLIAIPVRMTRFGHLAQWPSCPEIRQRWIFDERVRDVDPKPVDVAFEPELQHVVELGADVLVRPVEIGLLRGEEMQIPLTR